MKKAALVVEGKGGFLCVFFSASSVGRAATTMLLTEEDKEREYYVQAQS